MNHILVQKPHARAFRLEAFSVLFKIQFQINFSFFISGGHSFCSLCIRTHLASDNNNNKNCPICFKPISALDLIPDIMTSQILGTMGLMAKFFEKLKILAENPEVKEILKDMENEKKEE